MTVFDRLTTNPWLSCMQVHLAFSSPRYEEMVEVPDDLPRISVRLLYNGLRDARLAHGQQSRKPLAVDVDTVLDGVVLDQRQ